MREAMNERDNGGPMSASAGPEVAPPAVPFLTYLNRQSRLEALADRAFMLALALGEAEPTRDGIASLTVEARSISTELTALREAD